MNSTDTAIPAFDHLPEIQRLGTEVIQRLSDEWLRTGIARKYDIEKIVIGEKGGRPSIVDFSAKVLHDPTSNQADEPSVDFPVDDLMLYIIERAIADPEARLRLKGYVKHREMQPPHEFQRSSALRPRPLYVRCKNRACQTLLATQYTIPPGRGLTGELGAFTCPQCGETNSISSTDFFTLDVPEEVPVEIKDLQDPGVKWFSIVIPWRMHTFSLIAPVLGRLNNAEFEGKPAETVYFFGPQGSSAMPLGRLYFLYREHSFNTVFREATGTWEEVRHVATNKTLYELADFSVLSRLKVETLRLTDVVPHSEQPA